MNKFVAWFHNRSEPIQAVIKLAITLLMLGLIAGFVALLFFPVGQIIDLAIVVANLAYAIWAAVGSWIED